MAVTKKIQIQNPAGTGFDSRDIGAEGQYVEVSRDSNGNIIEDITASGVVVDSTESLTETLKNIEDNKQDKLTFDNAPTSGSSNPVTSDGIYQALQNVDIDVDSALSTTSENPVQNKVITGALNKRVATYNEAPNSWDTTPTQNSTKPLTSGGVYDALQGVGANDNFLGTIAEWEALTDSEKEQYKTVDLTDDFNGIGIDTTPTQNSNNVVTSGGIYDALQNAGGAGHEIADASGTTFPQEDVLQFENGWVEDDSTNGATIIKSDNFIGTQAEWNALSSAEKAKYKSRDITDELDGIATIDYVDDKSKVTRFEVSTSSWVEDTTSQSGTTLYKKSIALNNVYVSSPSVDIGSTGVLPTAAQQDAYNLLQYVTVDSAVPCLYLYASNIPTDSFYINVEGVD